MLLRQCALSCSLRAIITTGAVCLYAAVAHAHATGVTTLDFDSRGCNQCHFGGVVPPVQLGGPTLVAPGSTNEYTLQVSAVGTQTKAGLNVSAATGVLTTGGSDADATQVLTGTGDRNEITQAFTKTAVNGTITFTFLWTAPSSGSTTLTAWGNAVNGNFKRSGDQAASTDLTISVSGSGTSPTPTATPGVSACVGDCDDSGDVTVDELITMVNIALGNAQPTACPQGIPSGAAADVTLVVQAVNEGLSGCGG